MQATVELPEAVGQQLEALARREGATGHQFLAAIRCEPIPERAGDLYAAVKLARQRSGLNLDENDLWIAATALALGATLVIFDKDFEGIDGLPLVALT